MAQAEQALWVLNTHGNTTPVIPFIASCFHQQVQDKAIGPQGTTSRVAQWKRAGPITQRSMDRNHPLLPFFFLWFKQIAFNWVN